MTTLTSQRIQILVVEKKTFRKKIEKKLRKKTVLNVYKGKQRTCMTKIYNEPMKLVEKKNRTQTIQNS